MSAKKLIFWVNNDFTKRNLIILRYQKHFSKLKQINLFPRIIGVYI